LRLEDSKACVLGKVRPNVINGHDSTIEWQDRGVQKGCVLIYNTPRLALSGGEYFYLSFDAMFLPSNAQASRSERVGEAKTSGSGSTLSHSRSLAKQRRASSAPLLQL